MERTFKQTPANIPAANYAEIYVSQNNHDDMDDDDDDRKNTAGVTCSVLPNALILCFSCFWISESRRCKVKGERWKVIHNVISIANLGSNLCSKCINYITKVNIIMYKSPHNREGHYEMGIRIQIIFNCYPMFVSFLSLEND